MRTFVNGSLVLAIVAAVSTSTANATPINVSSYTNNYGSITLSGKDAPSGAAEALIDGLGQDGVYTPTGFFWEAGQEGTIYLDGGSLGQPTVTFDLGAVFNLDSVVVHYGVRTGSSVHAPGSVDVSVDGNFVNNFAGFDNSASVANFGDIRSLTIDLTGQSGQSVEMVFNSALQWVGLTEVEFEAVPEPMSGLLFGITLVGLALSRRRRRRDR